MNYSEEKPVSAINLIGKIVIAIAGLFAGFLLSRLFITPYTVNDISMKPNLSRGDRILVVKHITPAYGDIVLADSPIEEDRVILKRVIAGGGDMVEIRNRIIYINNKKSRFQWKTLSNDKRIFPMSFTNRDNMPLVKLQRDEYFLIGDNSDKSLDSRTYGVIKEDLIIGKMIYKF